MTIGMILADKGREIVSIEPAATLKSAATLLAEKRIGAVVILGADRRIIGILSERDIVRAIGERGIAALDESVSQTMTRKVSTCTEGETLISILERMTEGKFRHVPVVDQGRLFRGEARQHSNTNAIKSLARGSCRRRKRPRVRAGAAMSSSRY